MSGSVSGVAVLALALAGGGWSAVVSVQAPAQAPAARSGEWRRLATDADRLRLRNWRETWLGAVAAARAVDRAGVEREAPLFDPDRALADGVPPAGDYRCRTFKLGARGTGARDFTAYPWFACRIEAGEGTFRFAKLDGSQRPVGRIYPDGARGVFLGALVLGDESRAMRYGRDASRDLAGLVERVGPRRWRIAFPEPRFESRLDVIELVPAG